VSKEFFKINYENKKPKNYKKFNIGIIGAGNIVENSHLPIYKKNNLNVKNIFDINQNKARKLKKKFKIEKYSKSLDEFLNDKSLDIVDIAVPAEFNKELFVKSIINKKNILIQKPLSNNLETAEEIKKIYKQSSLKSNVNHQMQFSPAISAAKSVINNKYLGKIISFKLFTYRFTDWSIWPWLEKIDYPEIRYNSIHYLDTIRYLFGNPQSLVTKLKNSDNDIKDKPMNTNIFLKYPDFYGELDIIHNSKEKSENWRAGYEIIGDNGRCDGVISSMIGNGYNFLDSIKLTCKVNGLIYEKFFELEGRWFSEAFLGPIYSLMDSINNDTEPRSNIYEAYETLILVEKVIQNQN